MSAERGPKRPTIVDVAARAGVSKSLVSLVMRDSPRVGQQSRDAVLRAARELGYRPNAVARSLVRRSSGVLGCILSDLHNPFFADIADGIEVAAGAAGYRALLSAGFLDPARETAALETLLELQVDGLMTLGAMLDLRAVEASAREVPVVVVGQEISSSAIDSVRVDDIAGARAVVDHLVALGHRRIAHLHGGEASAAVARRRGYERAMARHGLGPQVRSVQGAFTEAGGHAAMCRIIESGELPTAVFVANDFAAMGALEALDRAGIGVPDQLSVAGYDDIPASRTARVSLTTVSQPAVDMGRTAVSLLLQRLGSTRSTARHVVMAPQLVVRGTTAPPSA